MAYAVGKKALGLCDRCGFTYKLNELKYEVQDQKRTGSRVCTYCFDPDHPQLRIGDIDSSDNQALFNPRPDSGEKDSTTYFGFNPVSSTGMVMRNDVGQVKVVTGETSSSAVDVTGLSATASVGTVSLTGIDGTAAVTGLAGTSALGTVSVTAASSVTTYTITVVGGNPSNHPYYNFGSSNKFAIDGSTATADVTLSLSEGSTYKFDQSDSSNSGHPLRFSTTANGTHSGGSEYTTGVTTNGTPGSSGAYTQITVAVGAPTLYYYCTNHSGMGWTANTP